MARKGAALDRILRVRDVQLGMVRAEEARAQEKLASETALRDRIAALAANIAPVTDAAAAAFSLKAAAHYRERLHQSASAAEARVAQAVAQAERAADATREARRDQSAIEKLIAKRATEAALKEMRALQNAPPIRKVRHDPC
ncbi:hypothetical protein [Sphingomonas sp.]|uniref:hypothetical protein n=1 Tax=Sphingomonas sp. TaxID=28214 RepID=UPI001DE98492|nr:hypothetical protein [Sphingomonas sp.]MBX9795354.1 hypothetical protein [Sphingomonas sp.]